MLLTICHTIVHISNLLKMISLAIQTKKEVTRDFLGIANDVAGNWKNSLVHILTPCCMVNGLFAENMC